METDVLLHVLHLSTYHLIQRGKGWGGSWDKRPVLGAVLSSLGNLLAGAAPGAGGGGWGRGLGLYIAVLGTEEQSNSNSEEEKVLKRDKVPVLKLIEANFNKSC